MIKNASRKTILSAAVLTLLTSAVVHAQRPAPDPSLSLVQEAFKLTDPAYLISFNRYCMLNGPNTANGKGDAAIPSQLFDNLYYVGRTDVGAWVLKTSEGLVLFDTLNNTAEAANII